MDETIIDSFIVSKQFINYHSYILNRKVTLKKYKQWQISSKIAETPTQRVIHKPHLHAELYEMFSSSFVPMVFDKL